ncbi:MAG: CBS domain-containing protein [Gammaproteobacteria bacterium]|nr:CBS domain-containing protein [Gammaproteobacteria bacterium]NIN62325.1 CBS domain-containing protein [Gammaproteobacteria bacterium]NIO62334.1 CBS domain-containing protein [Gammaproteobacteria bacterium]NIP49641.1 CBS domain-containing protein [Gammaproteobacteria bacterium]NIQ10866.1 CBS domain-containing protein [Gammaproteobacteria bacterium]
MTTSIVTLAPDMDILKASQLLVNHGISGAPVVDDLGNLVGMLTERDCFKITLNAGYFEELGGKVSEFMSRDVETVAPEMSVLDLAELFLRTKYRRYPVILDNRLIGLISRRDTLKAMLDLTPSTAQKD